MAYCAHDHCSGSDNRQPDARYRRILWVALGLNGGMFLTELLAGLAAGSAALQADAVDFLSDAANYGMSLSVLGLVLVWRARAALVKGISMGLLGLWVVAASNGHVLAFDNVSGLPAWISDTLCRLATGGVTLCGSNARRNDNINAWHTGPGVHNSGPASASSMASGILMTKSSSTTMKVEYPPWVIVPSLSFEA